MTIKANGFAYDPIIEFPRYTVYIARGGQVVYELSVKADSVADAIRMGNAAAIAGERAVSARLDHDQD